MSSSDRPRVVLKYYAYRATARPDFHYPIYTLFLLYHDLSFTAIGTIASVQSLVVVAGEVPTGYVGDRVGRRNSLVIASTLFLVSISSYLVATDFPGFLFTFTTLSLGHTFVSGSGSAWLYDTLEEHGIEDEFTHVGGRASAIGRWVGAASMVVGGLLYVQNHYYPFVAGVALTAVNLALVLSLPKNAQYADREVESGPDGDEARLSVMEAVPIVRDQVTKPSMRSFIAYMALVGGALMTADIYIQPIARDALSASVGGTLSAWGVPEAATLGVLYASFTAISAVVSDYAGDVEDRFGARAALVAIPLGVAVLYLLPPLLPVLAFPMFFAMKGGFTLVWPISSRYMNDRIDSVGRATVLSAVSMLRAVAGVPFRVGSGVLADWTSTLVAVAGLGLAFVLGTVALHAWSPPVQSSADADATAD